MGQQIIKQPDGLYAVFSSVVDNFTTIDATADELIELFAEQAARDCRDRVKSIIERLDAGERAYHQFTMTIADAIRLHRANKINSDAEFNAAVEAMVTRTNEQRVTQPEGKGLTMTANTTQHYCNGVNCDYLAHVKLTVKQFEKVLGDEAHSLPVQMVASRVVEMLREAEQKIADLERQLADTRTTAAHEANRHMMRIRELEERVAEYSKAECQKCCVDGYWYHATRIAERTIDRLNIELRIQMGFAWMRLDYRTASRIAKLIGEPDPVEHEQADLKKEVK